MAAASAGNHGWRASRQDTSFYRTYAGVVWTAMWPVRTECHRDGTACDESPPYGPSSSLESRWCSKRCDQLWAEALSLTAKAFSRHCAGEGAPINPAAWVRTVALSKAREAARRLRLEAGVLARPDRAVQENRFLIDLFDDRERAVLGDLLYYVVGDDLPEATAFPIRRLADRHGLSEGTMGDLVDHLMSVLEQGYPIFAERNLIRPLSQKLAQHATDDGPFYSMVA